MQFVRISLLIFALGFFFACSLGTQNYGKLSLSIKVPDYLKTETKSHNTRFIHPNGNILNFELYTKSRVIHTQTITLNPQPNNPNPQRVSITVDKVPYNVPLSAKITVFGKTPTQGNEVLLGSNDIYIGYLKSGNNKLTLGVKPESGTNVAYVGVQVGADEDIYLETYGNYADTFNIEMFPKKGLYTISVHNSANIYLYDSDGKKYQNSFLINDNDGQKTRVFYHPEDKASTYYAYLSGETSYPNGEKLDQDILITRYDDNMDSDVIVISEENIDFDQLSPDKPSTEISFTIYNTYPFTLNPNYNTEEDNPQSFTFNNFPDAILPGTSKEFTVIFESTKESVEIPITISAPGLKDFVLHFTGTGSGL